MDITTKILFGRVPREVAIPQRHVIESVAELQRFIINNNGLHDCYTSVYPTNYLIDKIYTDNDYGLVLKDSQQIYKWCLDKGYDAVPVVSGKKGYHIYIITKPKIYGKDAKILLTRATYSIIQSVFGPFRQEMLFVNGKEVQVFRTKDRVIAVDPAPCGDIRRITRIPNTLRPPENLNYCTYLPPYEFLDMTEEDVTVHMKTVHSYDYKIDFSKAPLLTDFEFDFNNIPDPAMKWNPVTKGTVITTDNPNRFLQGLLRPCLYRHLSTIHPNHSVRVASTVDLLQKDYNPTEILSLYEKLGWEDFESVYCLKQIESCKKYKPYSCTKLRQLGVPRQCCLE